MMKIELTEEGKEAAEKLQLPIDLRDAVNMIVASKKIKGEKIEEKKIEALILIRENEFYKAIIKIIEIITFLEDEKKEVIIKERNMEIKL